MPSSTTGSSPWHFLDRDHPVRHLGGGRIERAGRGRLIGLAGWQVDVAADGPTRTYPNSVLPASAPVTVFSASAVGGIAYSTLASATGFISLPWQRLTVLSASQGSVGQLCLTYLQAGSKQ